MPSLRCADRHAGRATPASIVPVEEDGAASDSQSRSEIGPLHRAEMAASRLQKDGLIPDRGFPLLQSDGFARGQRTIGQAVRDAGLLANPSVLQRTGGGRRDNE